MRDGVMCWERQGERTWTMELAEDGAEWVEVKRLEAAAGPIWRVDARLNGSHYKIADAFATKETAQGCALLLAMRQLPARRDALHAQIDVIPGAWWWKITPTDDASAERRSIFSSRVEDSEASAERSGRAVGRGWCLYVYGPGSARAFGLLPK